MFGVVLGVAAASLALNIDRNLHPLLRTSGDEKLLAKFTWINIRIASQSLQFVELLSIELVTHYSICCGRIGGVLFFSYCREPPTL